jgi:hypothetical protein
LDEQGRSEAAIDCLRRALQAAPDYADAMFNLALLLQRGSRHKADTQKEKSPAFRLEAGLKVQEHPRFKAISSRTGKG